MASREWHSEGQRFEPAILHFTKPLRTNGLSCFLGPEATRPGLEPGTREPKSLVLPLHHRVVGPRVVGDGFQAGHNSGAASSGDAIYPSSGRATRGPPDSYGRPGRLLRHRSASPANSRAALCCGLPPYGRSMGRRSSASQLLLVRESLGPFSMFTGEGASVRHAFPVIRVDVYIRQVVDRASNLYQAYDLYCRYRPQKPHKLNAVAAST